MVRNAFEWALPMNAYPSIPIPISGTGPPEAADPMVKKPTCSLIVNSFPNVLTGVVPCLERDDSEPLANR